jgi:hypothetical protein
LRQLDQYKVVKPGRSGHSAAMMAETDANFDFLPFTGVEDQRQVSPIARVKQRLACLKPTPHGQVRPHASTFLPDRNLPGLGPAAQEVARMLFGAHGLPEAGSGASKEPLRYTSSFTDELHLYPYTVLQSTQFCSPESGVVFKLC